MNRALWGAGLVGIIAFVWGAVALGSYVYLWGMGYPNEFAFPYNQLWIALPYILHGGWQGVGTLMVWEWAAAGLAATFLPFGIVSRLTWNRYRDQWRQPKLHGEIEFANRSKMQRGGITTKRRLF